MRRPVWSVMIPTYNCAGLLREAIESVLCQDLGPELMQIEVVDDCSVDQPEQVVAEIGRGRTDFFRQASNVGNVGNFNSCLQRSRGRIVHLLHGDDRVEPGFYETLERPLLEYPEVGAAFCRYVAITEDGRPVKLGPLERTSPGVVDDWLSRIGRGQRLQPPAMVVRRDVYERVGGFEPRLAGYAEDWEMWVRIAAATRVWYDPSPLALYRIHEKSISGAQLQTGTNVQKLRLAIELNRAHFGATEGRLIANEALRSAALAALRRGGRLLRSGDSAAMWAQFREALRSDRSARVLGHAVGLVALRVTWPLLRPLWPWLRTVRHGVDGWRCRIRRRMS